MKKIIFLFTITLFFLACKPSKIVDVKGRVRLINASSTTGDLNMFLDYQKVYATNVEYLNYSLFREYLATKHKLQIKDAVGNLLIDTSINVEDKKSYSVFVYDSLSDVKSYLPIELKVENVCGIRIFTPFALMHKIPVVKTVLQTAESWASQQSVLKNFGGFMVVIVRKI